MSNQQQSELELRPVRHPLDPITISDSYSLIAITIGAAFNGQPVEQYLMELSDNQAEEVHWNLVKEMLRPDRVLTPEEYGVFMAQRQ